MSKRCRPLIPISSEEAEQRILVAWLTIRGVDATGQRRQLIG